MPDGDTGRALLAGWVSGAAVAFATTALVLIALAYDPAWQTRVNRSRLRLPILGVVVVNAMMLFWTLVGLVLGAVFLGTDQPAFSITIVVVVALALGLYAVIRGMPGWLTWSTVAVALAGFGVMLPALAGLG